MKKNKSIIYLIYSIIVFVFELSLLLQDKSLSPSLIPFYLSFYIFGYFSICEYNKTKNLFSLEIIFNLFGLLYTNYYISQLIYANEPISNNVYISMYLSYLSMFSFNVAYMLTKTGVKTHSKNIKYNSTIIFRLLLLFLIVSLAAEVYVIFIKIGFETYASASRAKQTLLMGDYSILSFYKNTIPLISFTSLYFGAKNKSKKYYALFAISFIIAILNSFLSVSRAELLSLLLPVIFLMSTLKKIKIGKIILMSILIFILFGAWKGIANGETNIISYDSEFNTWYKICNNVLSDDIQYINGESYGKTAINLFIPITKTESLSTWYVKKYEHDIYLRGGGRGFSGVLEAYINFSWIGNIIIYAIYGIIIKKIKKDTDLQIIIYMIVMISIYQMFRSESYSLWKNMAWFKILPILIIFYISRRSNNKIELEKR